MACEKHSESMTDLAAGDVNPRRERELLLHAGECDVCREAYQHAKEVFATLDRSVETLVAGEPSPYFAARLRARIADERVFASAKWNSWPWAVVATGALAAIVLVLILVSRWSLPANSNPSVATHTSATALKPETNVTAQNGPRTPQYPKPGRVSRDADTERLSLEVLVPRGQLAAALQLGDAVNGGGMDGEQLLASQIELGKQLEVKPLEITPLESSSVDLAGTGSTRF
jgi:hypothetical protein